MGFLTKKDIKELTGYSCNSKAIKVMKRQGIGFVTDMNGNIKTTWNAVNTALINSHGNRAHSPDFSHIQ